MRWWRGLLLVLGAGWLLLLATRCHLPRQTIAPGVDRDSTSAVYLVRHGWHAGIAVRRADVPTGRWPVFDDNPSADYLEVGWGEVRYYPGESRGVWGVLRAGLWPTGSVLHVVPIADAVRSRFPDHTIARIPVDSTELAALTQYVSASFTRTADQAAVPAAPGVYPDSRFYRADLTYHAFNNCNHWAAGALEAAGCDTAPRWTFTVGQVVRQAEACGTLGQRRATD